MGTETPFPLLSVGSEDVEQKKNTIEMSLWASLRQWILVIQAKPQEFIFCRPNQTLKY